MLATRIVTRAVKATVASGAVPRPQWTATFHQGTTLRADATKAEPTPPQGSKPQKTGIRELTYRPPSIGKDLLFQMNGGTLTVQADPAEPARTLEPYTMRDNCACSKCRDPVSGQKSFASTEIPIDLAFESVDPTDKGLVVTFNSDVKSAGGGQHKTVVPWSFVEVTLGLPKWKMRLNRPRRSGVQHKTGVEFWDRDIAAKKVRKIDYREYMEGGEAFWNAVLDISRLGLVFLKNVPHDPESVVKITTRMANIRETFYGRTFDVKAKPNAENIAYTPGYLGLHQDLLYLDPPPRIQILHCMENSCTGGESLFSDGERVGRLLLPFMGTNKMSQLAKQKVPYAYTKNGYNYYQQRPLVHVQNDGFQSIYWSPPFQGTYRNLSSDLKPWIQAASVLEELINREDAIYQTKMEPGECAMFDNLRVMHGRNAFDATGGSRWLRGAYIASEDFYSRASQIPVELAVAASGGGMWSAVAAQKQLRNSKWHKEAVKLVEKIDPDMPEDLR